MLLQLKNDPRTLKIPVIVVTILDQPGLGGALGADEYLVKPVDKRTLLSAVERCLRSRGGAAPARPILVVEDDPSTREVVVDLLSSFGYTVTTASDGEEARAAVARSLPALVILDPGASKNGWFWNYWPNGVPLPEHRSCPFLY